MSTSYLDEGYIKYQCFWKQKSVLSDDVIKELNHWRMQMYQQNWIGYYEQHQVGFGNISIRHQDHSFIISGTQTGHLPKLTVSDYALVNSYNIDENWLKCEGSTKASSEALTHAAIYDLNPDYQAVIHIHDKQMWEKMMYQLPTSSPNVPYGTPQMAYEIKRLYETTDLAQQKILVMGGHEEGIIAFGKNLQEAAEVLLTISS